MFKKFFSLTKKRRSKKMTQGIIRYGLALLGFDILLGFCFFFGIMAIQFLYQGFYIPTFYDAFLPLMVLFIFAGGAAVVWFRYGQLLGAYFSKHRYAVIIFTSLIAIVGLIALLSVLLLLFQLSGLFTSIAAMLVLSFTTVVLLATAFQVVVVLLGAHSK